MLELQAQQQTRLNEELQDEMQVQQQIQQLEIIVKRAMTKEAIERYGTLKMAHPEKAIQALVVLAQAIQQGKIQGINDNQFKEILQRLTPEKKKFNVTRK
jgi:DNA-binding TFAR19-related protein (PDSD5 family)